MNDDLANIEVDQNESVDEFCTYVCSTCQTTFNSMNPSLKKCIFCGGENLLSGDKKSFDAYEYLPFAVSLDEAYDLYKKQIRYNVLVPFSFRGKPIREKIQKAYIPCCLYHISVDGNISFYGADPISKVPNAPKQVFDCLYSTHFDYSNLLTSNFNKIDDVSISNINDYDFSNLVPFDSTLTKDSSLLVSDSEMNAVTEKIQEKVLKQCVNIVRGSVGHELKKLSENKMTLDFSSAKAVLIPVYFINFRYQGQEYLFLVNGQTKKMIIDLPIRIWNVVLFCVVCFLLLVLIGSLVVYFI